MNTGKNSLSPFPMFSEISLVSPTHFTTLFTTLCSCSMSSRKDAWPILGRPHERSFARFLTRPFRLHRVDDHLWSRARPGHLRYFGASNVFSYHVVFVTIRGAGWHAIICTKHFIH